MTRRLFIVGGTGTCRLQVKNIEGYVVHCFTTFLICFQQYTFLHRLHLKKMENIASEFRNHQSMSNYQKLN